MAGAVLGHQVGGGTGKTIATAGGAVAGGIAGHQLEKHLKKYTVWVTKVTMKDGKTRTFEYDHDPALAAGAVVKVEGDRLVKP